MKNIPIDSMESPSASPSSSHHFRHFLHLFFSNATHHHHHHQKNVLTLKKKNPLFLCFCSSPRHYYVAVDRLQFKMETLVDLLGVAGRRHSLPIALCCSSRDELDAVCSTVSNLSYISLASLYSDLAEAERILILEKFRRATSEWNQNVGHLEDGCENGDLGQKSFMIVVTDACLPVVASGETPIAARILINYELPTKKETYLRRISTCLAADGVVINMVVGGEVVTLKGIEESSGLIIAEMPINISEIL